MKHLEKTEERILMSTRSVLIFALLAALSLAPATWAATIHVDHAAGGDGDGSSWEHAYSDLQDALAAAGSGDAIWVAAGVYYPTDDASDRNASFQLRNGVEIYGGFPAGGDWEERDWQTHITVLSGDIDGNDETDDKASSPITTISTAPTAIMWSPATARTKPPCSTVFISPPGWPMVVPTTIL